MRFFNSIVLLIVSTLGLTACISSVGTDSTSNYGSYSAASKEVVMTEKWFLTTLNNTPYQGPRITLQISADNRVSGFSGCNRYFASGVEVRGDQLKFGSVGSTRKLCVDKSTQLERQYLEALRGVTHFNKSKNRLVLSSHYSHLTFYKKSAR